MVDLFPLHPSLLARPGETHHRRLHAYRHPYGSLSPSQVARANSSTVSACPLMGTVPSDAAGIPCPRTACQTFADIKSRVLNSLFNCSMRDARFTTSPVTLYSLCTAEPTRPA